LTLTKRWLKKFNWPETLLTDHPLAIARRGACDYAPENTLKSFQIAADLCSEMWELDVRVSADGVCVVVHDDNLGRIARRALRVSEATWEEISALRLPEDQHIPRLEQVIELAQKTGCGLYVHIKSAGAGPLAWKLLKEAGFDFAVLASFNVGWIREMRKSGCTYPLSILVPAGVDPFDCLQGVDVDLVHLCWRDAAENPVTLLTDDLLQKFADRGHQIVIWHEERADVLDALWDKQIMGICSDRPELLKPYRPDPVHPIDIVCHRGANYLAPENSLEAARICIDQRFQYVELDVRTTSDGELVVLHDADLKRTTSGDGRVIDHTLAEISALDAGGWFREGETGYQVPTLTQFLQNARDRTGVYIEIKQSDPAALLSEVRACNMLEHCFFWSADTDALHWLRAQSAEIVLMAARWMYGSVAEAAVEYAAQIVEFDVERDDLSEFGQCAALGVRGMLYSRRWGWDDLATYLTLEPDMINLDRPDRFKILVSYPKVRRHFLEGTVNAR